MHKCLICQTEIAPFISFGDMPIANGFLAPDQFEDEYFFDLQVSFCPVCAMVQLAEQPEREKMFHENYPFYSSTSTRMAHHFECFANEVITNHLNNSDPFVVEIGSNDGIMLQHFANSGFRHLGIEPSKNVAQVAIDNGIVTTTDFFDEYLARKIVAEHSKVDAFIGANVMCHIPYIHSVAAGIKILLSREGVLVFEDPYLGDIIEKTSYDQIYDEHAFYFSVASVGYLFAEYGMEIIDVQPQNVHGGSMRYVIAHQGAYPVANSVREQQAKEEKLKLKLEVTYSEFRRKIERSRDDLQSLLLTLNQDGKRVVGYAATSKSTTVTNYCGITSELVEFISDTTPIKQGKYSPGVHIPIRPYKDFQANYPDYALLFGWNHAKEILAKEQAFIDGGGKWIVYVPEVRIL